MYTQAFGFVGAQSTLFEFMLPPGKSTTIEFGDYGVPDEARILAINYTPQSRRLFPLQRHSNQLIENGLTWHDGQRNVAHLWPAAYEISPDENEAKVGCLVTWVDRHHDNPSMSNLIEAFAAYARERYEDIVIPANVAVEAAFGLVLNSYLSKFVDGKKVDEFLREKATFSPQLNVIMPVLAQLNGCPILPMEVLNILKGLRKLRNRLAHQGKLKAPLSKHDAAELLAAATFGVAYARFFEKSVQPQNS